MSITDIVNLFVNNGMAIVIVAYFLYRDYKFNEQQISLLTSVKEIVSNLQTLIQNVEGE